MSDVQLTEKEIEVLRTVRGQGADYKNQSIVDALFKSGHLGYDRLWGMYVLTNKGEAQLKGRKKS